MNGHLIAIEVGIERGADERMDSDGLSLHQHWFERLDSEPVKRRCPI